MSQFVNIEDEQIVELLEKVDQDLLNASNNRQENVHRLFQYPAMMVPLSQEAIINIISKFLPSNAFMIDPFMGSSTSIVISMKLGLNVFGQDINPLAVLLSKVKTGFLDYDILSTQFQNINETLDLDQSNEIEVNFPNINKWFSENVQLELSKLKRAIGNLPDLDIRRFFWIGLAETIRLTSNDRTSTYKLHQRPVLEIEKRNVSPITEFKKIVKRSLEDLKRFNNALGAKKLLIDSHYNKNVRVCWGDTSKKINSNIKYNLLVSSPPYGDNHTTVTYGQHAYLPLQWINLEDIDEGIDNSFLKTTQEIDRISLGGRINQEVIKERNKLFSKSKTLSDFYISFQPEEQNKLAKTIAFVNDFDCALDNILESLERNSYLIWTIGNRHVAGKELRNDQILIELHENKGLVFISDIEREILCKRMPNRNNISKTMSKEKILIFRKPF